MDTEALLSEVERAFPYVEKPRGPDLSFHADGCGLCRYLREDLELYSGRELPPQALRTIHGDMSCLSAAGWSWVLPSYLRHCLTVAGTSNDPETEFLIYNLSPPPEDRAQTTERFGALDEEQLACLVHFLEWCGAHAHWSDYCKDDISAALLFVRELRPRQAGRAST